jgi:hypothetical protein
MPATPDGALPADDAKLVTLARAARARVGGAEGAALRDEIGRTYAAGSVDLPSLRLTALQAAVAAAVSSGADHVVAACVVGDADQLTPTDRALLGDLGVGTVLLAAPDGTPRPA